MFLAKRRRAGGRRGYDSRGSRGNCLIAVSRGCPTVVGTPALVRPRSPPFLFRGPVFSIRRGENGCQFFPDFGHFLGNHPPAQPIQAGCGRGIPIGTSGTSAVLNWPRRPGSASPHHPRGWQPHPAPQEPCGGAPPRFAVAPRLGEATIGSSFAICSLPHLGHRGRAVVPTRSSDCSPHSLQL